MLPRLGNGILVMDQLRIAKAQTIYIKNPGIYNVTLISSSTNGCEDTISKTVNIEAPFTIDLGPDTSQCTGSIPLDATLPLSGLNYDWSNGSTSSNITASSSGLYWVRSRKKRM